MNEPKPKVALKHGYPDQQQQAADQYGQSRIYPIALPERAANTVVTYNPAGRRYRLHAIACIWTNNQGAAVFDTFTVSFNGLSWPGAFIVQGPQTIGGGTLHQMSAFIHGQTPYVGGVVLTTGYTDPTVLSMPLPAIDWDGDVTVSLGVASGANFAISVPMLFIEFLP